MEPIPCFFKVDQELLSGEEFARWEASLTFNLNSRLICK